MDIQKKKPTGTWRRLNWKWALVATVLLLLVIGLLGMGRAAPTAERSDLWIDTVQSGDMKREVRANGTLVPRDIRWIVAGATATVQQVDVLAGASVQSDTVIMVLVNPELQANLQKAQAAVSGATAEVAATRTLLASQLLDQQASLSEATGDWQLAQIRAKAYQRAFEGGAMSSVDVQESQIAEQKSRDRARLEGERVEAIRQNQVAQLRAAEAKRDEAESAFEIARAQVDTLEVKAGIDGILQQVEVEPGQQVEAGGKLARVARPEELIARLLVPEMLAKDLALELPVNVDTRNGAVAGTVNRIDPAVRNGSVVVDVALNENLPRGSRPDQSVDGAVLLGTLEGVMSIGRPALATPGAEGFLFVIRRGDSIAHRTRVVYGSASSDRIEVREGLRAGDQVVLSDTSRWNDQDRLKIR